MLHRAFDLGITHFDFANNYGPPPGSAESFAGKVLAEDFKGYRDELIISSKAGYGMWPGPYGEWGSRKYLLASLDQSLQRLGLDYVDIFYSHRPDPDTPLEETIGALDSAVRQGKALYVGISSYNGAMTEAAMKVAQELRTPLIIHQPSYSMLNRWIESDLLPHTRKLGLGVIAFCPLAQGLLTDKYLAGIPANSRAASADGFLRPQHVTPEAVAKVKQLNAHRATSRSEHGADGVGVGAARRSCDQRIDRREPRQPDRRKCRCARQPEILPCRTAGNRTNPGRLIHAAVSGATGAGAGVSAGGSVGR